MVCISTVHLLNKCNRLKISSPPQIYNSPNAPPPPIHSCPYLIIGCVLEGGGGVVLPGTLVQECTSLSSCGPVIASGNRHPSYLVAPGNRCHFHHQQSGGV